MNLILKQTPMKGKKKKKSIFVDNLFNTRVVKLEEIKEALELPSMLPLGRGRGESRTPPPTPYGTPYIAPHIATQGLDSLAAKMEKL